MSTVTHGKALARALALACAPVCLALGCSAQAPDAIEGVAGFGRNAPRAPDDGLDPEPLAFAVVSSDRTISSISLLQPDGELLRGAFVHSGSATSGLVTALSGDVALPSRSGDPRTLTLIDRFRADVVTRIDVASGEILGQLRTEEREAGESAYSSNPQDLVILSEHEAWLSRYNPNLHAGADDPDAGNDLLRIDPATLERSGERIDLSALDTTAERTNPDSDEREQVRAYARPNRIARVGDPAARKLVVGLSRISRAYDAVGEGAVALIDVDSGDVQALELPGMRNCWQVAAVPDDASHVVVGCTGPLAKGSVREHAGIALLALAEDGLVVEQLWRAADEPDAAIAVFGIVALGGSVVTAVAPGNEDGDQPDRLYRVNLATGAQRELLQAEGAWVLGDGAYNPRAGRLLIPDASTDGDDRPTAGIHRLDVDSELDVVELDLVAVDDALPAWQVAPL
ncbi:MAG TPA: hypothetical protein VK509_22795 [Polyangiales bacterium]|nr:hypothetical protein [Polyangiales bacterium]